MTDKEMRAAKPDRVIGILGGMGPEATLDLYRDIINLTAVQRDQDHIRVLIYSNPKIPDRTRGIEGTGENPVPGLIESARVLEKGGAGIIAMPCNAAHHFLPEIQRHISIPILDMIEETIRRLCARFPRVKTAGLIATSGTVISGVYAKSLSNRGINVLVPDAEDQQRIQIAIDQVKVGIHGRAVREVFQSAGLRMTEAGAELIILGCTEVPLAFSYDDVNYPTLNPTRILAEAAVEWALRRR